MRISEVAERTGFSISTIRFYENSGLCPRIERGSDGKRVFSGTYAEWLVLLASLRATGMSLSRMRAFAKLYSIGDETILQRKSVLVAHRKSLLDRQSELDRCRAILNRKLQTYDKILEDKA